MEIATQEWLTDAYDYKPPRRGQVRKGVILKREPTGITVDIGVKRDGFVPQNDIDRLEEGIVSDLEPGQEIVARIVRAGDQDDNHILSVYQARQEKDWTRAEELLEQDKIWEGKVTAYNKGGLLVKFGALQGFVPNSHLVTRNGYSSTEERQSAMQEYIDETIALKIIEADREQRRLILSERLAERQHRMKQREELLEDLVEGEVRTGTVQQLTNFGAFVDLGGANGLVHISELAWHRVKHPSEVLQVGDEIEVYILKLDYKRKRIGLSLKRLQPNPWVLASKTYSEDQLVQGTVTNIVDFGAFVALDVGVEGLVHISELADEPQPEHPNEVVQRGDELVLRVLSIDPFRQRLSLSYKQVSTYEREQWVTLQAAAENSVEESNAQDNAPKDNAEDSGKEDSPNDTEA